MRIVLLQVGKTDESFIREGEDFFLTKIRRMTGFDVITVPDIKNTRNMSAETRKAEEYLRIIKLLKDGDSVILLDEKGKAMDSVAFSGFIQKEMISGIKRLVFIIGGPFGADMKLKARAKLSISLSLMAYSHQLVRLLFLEQLYRGLTIVKGIPYHHE